MRNVLSIFLVLATCSVASASTGDLATAYSTTAVAWILLRIVLLALFLCASVVAFKIPGTGVPELLALGMLAALLVPSYVRGDAQWYELALIALGLLLLAVEIFVVPGFGATGVGGILFLAIGLLLIFLPAASPTHTVSLVDLRNALIILVSGSFAGIASFAWISHRLPASWGMNKLVLRETNAVSMPEHLWPHLGDTGVAVTDLKPGGSVTLPDPSGAMRRVDVVSKRGYIPAGSTVIVTEVVGQVITVKPHEQTTVVADREQPRASEASFS